MKEQKTVKTLKGQLFGAVAMMLVATIALGTSTYAWFINNQTVEVQNMEMQVSTSTSLLVAVEKTTAGTFTGMKSLVTNEDIIGTSTEQGGWANFLTNKMTPASVTSASLADASPAFYATNNHVTNGKLDQFTLLTHDATNTGVGQGPVKKIGLKFLSSDNVDVYFGQDGLKSIADLITENTPAGNVGTVTPAEQVAAIRSTLRVAIVPQAVGKHTTVVPMVFQFDAGAVVDGHTNNTKYAGDKPSTTADEPNGTYAAIKAADGTSFLVTADGPLEALVPGHATPATKAESTLATVTGTGGAASVAAPTTNGTPLFQLTAAEEREVDVYIWLEGTDKDCLNYLSSYNFGLKLPFAAAPTPVA